MSLGRQKTTQKILRAAEENPAITREGLARLLGISPEGVKYHLDNLKKKGLIKRVGGRKEGMWIVKKNGDHKT
ncbi:MAG: winged helix-turn-helix transcriptional regulator [Nitrospirae bacterium]|nr:winged helix-turn-helix transcriptional regulator [Nitrospirota bacterium]